MQMSPSKFLLNFALSWLRFTTNEPAKNKTYIVLAPTVVICCTEPNFSVGMYFDWKILRHN